MKCSSPYFPATITRTSGEATRIIFDSNRRAIQQNNTTPANP